MVHRPGEYGPFTMAGTIALDKFEVRNGDYDEPREIVTKSGIIQEFSGYSTKYGKLWRRLPTISRAVTDDQALTEGWEGSFHRFARTGDPVKVGMLLQARPIHRRSSGLHDVRMPSDAV